jgi:hypothetical protein
LQSEPQLLEGYLNLLLTLIVVAFQVIIVNPMMMVLIAGNGMDKAEVKFAITQ